MAEIPAHHRQGQSLSSHTTLNQTQFTMSDLPKSEDPVSEPKDMSLDEQAEIQPDREMDSRTEDFETKASVAGS